MIFHKTFLKYMQRVFYVLEFGKGTFFERWNKKKKTFQVNVKFGPSGYFVFNSF